MSGYGMVDLDQVTVRFGDALAVSGVSATVRRGEWVGLIGPNGAGKTSLLRAIAQLERAGGAICVNGEVMGRLARRRRAQLVAYVPQQPEFPADMAVLDYTLLGRTPYIGYLGAESASDRECCLLLLERLGIDALATRRLSTLSGGELQRVALARALAQDTPVLLLDEPTSALDLGRRIDVLELIDELRHERNLTIISAIHDLTLAAQFADRLLLLAAGTLVADGLPIDVLDEAQLTASFGAHIRLLVSDDGQLVVIPQRYSKPSHTVSQSQELAGSPQIT